MNFLYLACDKFDGTGDMNRKAWDEYIIWSKLTHLTELVSLDGMLNEFLVEPDHENPEDWKFIHTFGQYETGFYTSLDYVVKKINKKDKFNLLTIIIEPNQRCEFIKIPDFEFVGYELLDKEFCNSALTNCGGFEETFLPSDLNDKGLIDNFDKAYDIKKRLYENNPNEPHADTFVIAVWRHKYIGR
ncbi:MAG TPA: hypothetical protein DEP28_00610 [Bacteroidetes bacterium]|nr:hypothetical protein [Ignavibacteria bacterium]HCA41732.1 hypothetical protein [Bacteroidota bacterium]HCN36385.1 hypothetical protein [Bacteroidota bacterium]